MSNAMEITSPGWKLMHKTGSPVCRNTVAVDFRGEPTTVFDGEPPHKPSSTGTVGVKFAGHEQWCYPSVYDMEWVRT